MNPFNLEAVLAKIDEIGHEDHTDLDPRMIKTHPEVLSEIKSFVERNAARFKSMPWVTPMSDGRMQLGFFQGDRELEIEFRGKKRVVCLAYSNKANGDGSEVDGLISWLNREEAKPHVDSDQDELRRAFSVMRPAGN